ncbi:MAG: hypothetical protein V4616_09995 [Bacteroidota bacterium]
MNILKTLSAICALSIALAACKKDEPFVSASDEIPATAVDGRWSEVLRVVSNDTSSTVDSTVSPVGFQELRFYQNKAYYYSSGKLTDDRLYTVNGANLTIYDMNPQETGADKYTFTLPENKMILVNKKVTSNGIRYFTRETRITYLRRE